MNLAAKGALGFASSALVSGVFTSSVRPSGPRTISRWIQDRRPDRRLLFDGYHKDFSGATPVWQFVWKKYTNDFSSGNSNPFRLTNMSGENASQEFRNMCKKLFRESVSSTDDEKYIYAVEYCTRPTLVLDLIWDQGYEIASDSDWNNLWKEYKNNNFWNITSATSDDNAPEKFKTKCKAESEKAQGNKKDASVAKVIKYCSKKRAG
ncbi:hypothetical protein MHC_01185 [Mycoplasma haemocanis str. Illinois]|uniref:Uncharacterized protein n=1 Tax=Mycoplasma haemocanis (strain Illinois) TaxID=1111676 RepID=H6N631_MYCHN|nr:hypothetical protein [Mycoplasma haemocanis]AEW45103.1 hypothetical protein MHC_01185 [Mycoplasma haemocanis str. Illinois]